MKSFNAAKIISILVVNMFALGVSGQADQIELTNGDHYRGTVLSMNSSNIEFQSEIQGRVILPRKKVAAVILNEAVAKPAPLVKTTVPPNGAIIVTPGSNAVAPPANGSPAAAPGSQADAVLQELRKQGVDSKLIDQVQEQIFGKASPEAAQKFNEMIGGLMTGRVSVDDVRKQAQNSINQIKIAKKELGGDAGEMLDSYLGILEKFVQEADGNPSPAKPTPPAAPVK